MVVVGWLGGWGEEEEEKDEESDAIDWKKRKD